MTYDIICLLLVVLAFIGGFQKGVIRIFSFLIAICLSAIFTIWLAPYVTDFLEASSSSLPANSVAILLILVFVLSSWLLGSLVRRLWKPIPRKKQSPIQNIAGGVILSIMMILSIAILNGFFEQTKIINSSTKHSSIAYKILTPIHEGSRQLWLNLTAHTRQIKSIHPPQGTES